MAGNRKHGYRRGNASGRNGNHPSNWYCDGCQREHGYKVTSWGTLDKKRLCSRQYEKAAKQAATNAKPATSRYDYRVRTAEGKFRNAGTDQPSWFTLEEATEIMQEGDTVVNGTMGNIEVMVTREYTALINTLPAAP